MFDAVLGKGFKGSKCKTLLKLAMARIKLLRNKRDIQIKQMRKDLAQLLQTRQDASARIRVENIIREQNIMAAYDIIELFCELVAVRLPIIEGQKTCPIDLKEAIASLIFASPRCADLPELLQVRGLFAAKYGKEFAAAAAELRPDCGVNRRIIEKLSVRAPPGELKLKLMKEIADEHNVDWDPADSEAELLKPPEDLLDGPRQFTAASQIPLAPQKNELPSVPSRLPENSFVRQMTDKQGKQGQGDGVSPGQSSGAVPPKSKYGSPPKNNPPKNNPPKEQDFELEDSSEDDDDDGDGDEYVKPPDPVPIRKKKSQPAHYRSLKEDQEDAYSKLEAAARAAEDAASKASAAARAAAALGKPEHRQETAKKPAFSDFIRSETRSFDDYSPSARAPSSQRKYAQNSEEEEDPRYATGSQHGKTKAVKMGSEERKMTFREEPPSREPPQHDNSDEEAEDDVYADLNARFAALSRHNHEREHPVSTRRDSRKEHSEDPVDEDAQGHGRTPDLGRRGVDYGRQERRAPRQSQPDEEEETVGRSAQVSGSVRRSGLTHAQQKGSPRATQAEDEPDDYVQKPSGLGKQSFRTEQPSFKEDNYDRGGRNSRRPVREERSPPEEQEEEDLFNTHSGSPLERSLRGKPSSSGIARYDSFNEADDSQLQNTSGKTLGKSNSSSSLGGMSTIDMFDISVREVQDHSWISTKGPLGRPSASYQDKDDAGPATWDSFSRGRKPQPESHRSQSGDRRGQPDDLKPTFFAVGLPPPPGHPGRYGRPLSPPLPSPPKFDDAPPSVPARSPRPVRLSPTKQASSRLYSPRTAKPPPQRPPPSVEVSPSFNRSLPTSSRDPVESSSESDSSPERSPRRRSFPPGGLPDIDSIRAQFKK